MQVGLLVSSPIFAEASKHVNAFRLIALGLAVWTLATAGCGLAIGAHSARPPALAILSCLYLLLCPCPCGSWCHHANAWLLRWAGLQRGGHK